MASTLTEVQLWALCRDVIDGQKIEDMTVHWDHPGFVNLRPEEPIEDGSGYAAMLIATPDFVNDEPNRIVFVVEWAGYTLSLPDKDVVWEEDTALETWRSAVAERMPLIKKVLEILRTKGMEGFRELERGEQPYEG